MSPLPTSGEVGADEGKLAISLPEPRVGLFPPSSGMLVGAPSALLEARARRPKAVYVDRMLAEVLVYRMVEG
jgi:hypothetical protein